MAATAIVRVASVTLAARAPSALADWYVAKLGLARTDADDDRIALAVGDDARLYLVPATAPDAGPRAAGLFHVAFRLPSRPALGRWALAAEGIVQAASDHGVSEAFYLTDPEGNGVEVYADRPRAAWPRRGDGVAMTTGPMDMAAVTAAGGAAHLPFPGDADIGHVHLKVGDLDAAKAFYVDRLGLRITDRRPGALFLAFDDYHHDLAVNVWRSQGAGPRQPGAPGLVEIVFARPSATQPDGVFVDPWGTRLVVGPEAETGEAAP